MPALGRVVRVRRQLPVEVHEDGAREMAGEVVGMAVVPRASGERQAPPYVEDDGRLGGVEGGGQLGRGDQHAHVAEPSRGRSP